MTSLPVQALGLLAGAIMTVAAVPRVIDIIRDPGKAKGESCPRNALMVTGNWLWLLYGILVDAWPITIMCGLNSVLIGIILWAVVRSTESNTVVAQGLEGREPSVPADRSNNG